MAVERGHRAWQVQVDDHLDAGALAADLATVAIGTETDGSIVCPSGQNGIVGVKPTLGLASRTGIVPISAEQDTAGPMTRNVTDAALLLGVGYGGFVALGPEVALGYFGVTGLGGVMGLMFLAFGLGGLIGPPFAG